MLLVMTIPLNHDISVSHDLLIYARYDRHCVRCLSVCEFHRHMIDTYMCMSTYYIIVLYIHM